MTRAAVIDQLGRFHEETELETSASRTYQVQTASVMTLFVRLGDWIGMASLIATVALVAAAWVRRRRE